MQMASSFVWTPGITLFLNKTFKCGLLFSYLEKEKQFNAKYYLNFTKSCCCCLLSCAPCGGYWTSTSSYLRFVWRHHKQCIMEIIKIKENVLFWYNLPWIYSLKYWCFYFMWWKYFWVFTFKKRSSVCCVGSVAFATLSAILKHRPGKQKVFVQVKE